MSHAHTQSSQMSNGSSSVYAERGANGHVPSPPDAVADVRKIGQACLAGLKQAGDDLKDANERVTSVEQSTAEKLGELDLRVSAVESSQQSLEALYDENKALKQSIEYLTNSVNPARQAKIEERQQETDTRIAQLLTQIASVTSARASASHTSGQWQTGPPTSEHISAKSATPEAAPKIEPRSPVMPTEPPAQANAPDAVPPQQSTFDKELVERVLAERSVHADALEEFLHRLEDLASHQEERSSQDNGDMAVPTFSDINFSIPLVDRKAFEHKRDWVQAWQQKLEQLQDHLSRAHAQLSQQSTQLEKQKNSLEQTEEQITDIGLKLRDVNLGLLDEAQNMAEVKIMQEDHEDELLKRLREVEEREEAIRQDEWIISQKDKKVYEKQAAEFRRKQNLGSLKRELQDRIETVQAIEANLTARGGRPTGLTSQLPPVDDLPSF